MHQDLGIYEIGENSVDLHIPYYPQEPWIKVAKSFDIALQELALTGQETVLIWERRVIILPIYL
jgi:hypothetical protein